MPGLAGLVVNGLLIGSAAVSLFPLLWMLSASLMAPGEASAFPPPLLPQHATLAAAASALGYDWTLQKSKVIDYDSEMVKAERWHEQQRAKKE